MEIMVRIIIMLGAALLTAALTMSLSMVAIVYGHYAATDEGMKRMASGKFEWFRMLLEAIVISASIVVECSSKRSSKEEIQGG